MFKRIVTACIAVLIVGCTGLPDDVEPVVGFDSERYLGTWHEIARLDHSFERNLSALRQPTVSMKTVQFLCCIRVFTRRMGSGD